MRLSSEYEAIFAAAAHYFTAIRSYSDAIAVLECCHILTASQYTKYDASTKQQLEAVNRLAAQIFTGWPKAYVPAPAELAELRRALRKLKRLLLPKVKRGRRTKTIYDLLRHVERRPAMYMHPVRMERLRNFVGQVLSPLKIKVEEGDPPFGAFEAWVDRRFPKFRGGAWHDTLLHAAGDDEEKAFELFFKELRAFRRSEKGA